jgi:2-polyprenyl-3-methyl-5-hydroxy-6-metoxy-1,4-benzoquinol methylase
MKRSSPCYLSCSGVMYPAFIKSGFTILRCSQCGLFVLEADTNYDEFLEMYYSQGYFMGDDAKFGYANYLAEEEMLRRNAVTYLTRIKQLAPEGSLLDVGCAAGYLMDEADKLGYTVSGIDTSAYITNLATSQIQSKIQTVPLHKTSFSRDSFDVVTMFDLIEHLNDPRTDLTLIASSIKPSGLLVIGTGDTGSLYARIFGKHNHFFAPPHHYFFFSRKTITELLKQSGFKVIKIESMGKWLTIPYVARVAKHFTIPFFASFMNSQLVKLFFFKKGIYLYFGDSMVVYAQKV